MDVRLYRKAGGAVSWQEEARLSLSRTCGGTWLHRPTKLRKYRLYRKDDGVAVYSDDLVSWSAVLPNGRIIEQDSPIHCITIRPRNGFWYGRDTSRSPCLKSVASAIAERRKAAGMNQAELAAAAGLGENTVRMLETGRHWPSLLTTHAIASALNVSVTELTGL